MFVVSSDRCDVLCNKQTNYLYNFNNVSLTTRVEKLSRVNHLMCILRLPVCRCFLETVVCFTRISNKHFLRIIALSFYEYYTLSTKVIRMWEVCYLSYGKYLKISSKKQWFLDMVYVSEALVKSPEKLCRYIH